jgi:hypothetical protein
VPESIAGTAACSVTPRRVAGALAVLVDALMSWPFRAALLRWLIGLPTGDWFGD